MTAQINRLTVLLGAGFLAIALATGYWQIARSDGLLQRADNPRRVLIERRVPRGALYDRNGVVLADTAGEPGAWTRHYPYPNLAPVIGYVSPLVGSAGLEAALDPVLHGDGGLDPFTVYWRTDILGQPPPGRAARLTINLKVQRVADTALGAQVGAVVVVQAQTGEVVAMASHPTFEPNDLDGHWTDIVNNPGALLLNRATFALYQPGGVLAPVIVAGALQAGLLAPQQTIPAADQPVTFDGQSIGCRQPPQPGLTISETLALGCPGPVAALARQLGPAQLSQLLAQFHFYTAPRLEIAATAPAADPSGQTFDAGLAGVGQGSLTVTPLQMALVTAALARGGQMPSPHLVLQTQNVVMGWESTSPAAPAAPVVDPAVANLVKTMLRAGLQATAITSTGGKTLAWYLGFSPYDDPHYAVAVLLENGDPRAAHDIGEAVLTAAQ